MILTKSHFQKFMDGLAVFRIFDRVLEKGGVVEYVSAKWLIMNKKFDRYLIMQFT